MNKENLNTIIKNLKIEAINKRPKGGQICGMEVPRIQVSHPDYDIVISIGEARSAYKNRELAIELFKLALDDLY